MRVHGVALAEGGGRLRGPSSTAPRRSGVLDLHGGAQGGSNANGCFALGKSGRRAGTAESAARSPAARAAAAAARRRDAPIRRRAAVRPEVGQRGPLLGRAPPRGQSQDRLEGGFSNSGKPRLHLEVPQEPNPRSGMGALSRRADAAASPEMSAISVVATGTTIYNKEASPRPLDLFDEA